MLQFCKVLKKFGTVVVHILLDLVELAEQFLFIFKIFIFVNILQ